MRTRLRSPILAIASTLLLCASVAQAQAQGQGGGQASAEELAKQLSNPIADLVSVPFQFNWENGVGTDDDLRFVLNVQPVVPVSWNENWNLIGRLILPFVSQPPLSAGGETEFGTGDVVASAFFSPAAPEGGIWGVGPVFGIPTTSNPALGSGKWSIGPTAVYLKQQGRWTYGGLVNHLWSIADTGDRDRADVNQSFLQPFLAYTTPGAVTFTVNSESTANWEADSGQKWTIPINAVVSKVTGLGPFPMSLAVGAGYFIEAPRGGPEWKLRLAATIILPRAK